MVYEIPQDLAFDSVLQKFMCWTLVPGWWYWEKSSWVGSGRLGCSLIRTQGISHGPWLVLLRGLLPHLRLASTSFSDFLFEMWSLSPTHAPTTAIHHSVMWWKDLSRPLNLGPLNLCLGNWPKSLGPYTHVGDLEEAPGPKIQAGLPSSGSCSHLDNWKSYWKKYLSLSLPTPFQVK